MDAQLTRGFAQLRRVCRPVLRCGWKGFLSLHSYALSPDDSTYSKDTVTQVSPLLFVKGFPCPSFSLPHPFSFLFFFFTLTSLL